MCTDLDESVFFEFDNGSENQSSKDNVSEDLQDMDDSTTPDILDSQELQQDKFIGTMIENSENHSGSDYHQASHLPYADQAISAPIDIVMKKGPEYLTKETNKRQINHKIREHEKPHEYMDRIAREGWEANLNHSLPQHYYREKLKKRDRVLRQTGYIESGTSAKAQPMYEEQEVTKQYSFQPPGGMNIVASRLTQELKRDK